MERKIATAYCDDVLGTLDGVEIAKLISTGEIKEIEAVEAAIARALKVNPIINAIAAETYELALNQINDPSDTPFRGVPSFIKDNEDIKGIPTLFGSRAIANKPAKKSSKFVKLYNNMGFRIIGKSTLPELGLTGTTEPLATGPTRNPWNLDYSTGGSSGGSAALVASGVVPIAYQYEAFFNKYDLILSPTTATLAPVLGYLDTELDFNMAFERLLNFVPFTPYQNIAGAPAISLPLGYCKEGLPVGIQFAAALGKERLLIELAFELEEAIPWSRIEEA